MNDFWFVTFGDSRLEEARRRIRHQAERMGVFGEHIRVFTEKDLDSDFCERMRPRLLSGSRGFGYWCWKPQIILQVLREMPDGDVLLYTDIGCHLNRKGVRRLEEYREYAREDNIVAFQARALGERARTDLSLHFLPERQWSKMDLLNYFGVADRCDILDTGQIGATMLVLQKNTFSQTLIEKWRQCYYDHFELVDDTPSVSPNLSDFKENRHDQSVFSLLCKKYGAHLLSSGEYAHIRCYMPEGGDKKLWPEYWSEMKQFPVHARRDLGKYSKMVECPDWLKPILGKYGRRSAARIYELAEKLVVGRKRNA